METLFNSQWIASNPIHIFSFLFDMTWKCSLIILFVVLITRILHRGSSATRHIIWSVALVGMLLLPVFSLILPSWKVPVLPDAFSSQQELTKSDTSPMALTMDRMESSRDPATSPNENPEKTQGMPSDENRSKEPAGDIKTASQPMNPSFKKRFKAFMNSAPLKQSAYIFIIIWSLGMGVLLLRQLIGQTLIGWMALKAAKITDPDWLKLLDNLRKRQGITRSIPLLQSEKATLPMTWGFIRPKIMLPSEADQWSDERRQFVLLHELAHVKRWDTLTQLLVQLSSALYWFNPFIWIAHRQFLKEREHACDDYVLKEGSKASEYAGLLLDIAQSLPTAHFTSLATVAMARRTQLEGRLLAILDPQLRRRTLTRLAVVLSTLGILTIVVPLAAMRPMATAQKNTDPLLLQHDPGISSSMEIAHASEVGQLKSANVEEETDTEAGMEEIPAAIKNARMNIKPPIPMIKGPIRDGQKDKLKQQKKSIQDNNAIVIRSLSEALKDPILEVRMEVAETLGRFKNPVAVKALIPALKDENKQMRMKVAEALGDIGDKTSVEPLIAILKDVDWEVRTYVAEALGDLEDPRAVKPLGELLHDENRNVRKNVVSALSEIDHRSAVPPLTGALKDVDWEIRKEAASALGEIEDPDAITALSQALSDDNLEVRKVVVHALGEIENQRALKPLSQALQDEAWEVRKEAAWALGEIADPLAVAPLSVAINDENSEVRKTVVWALGELDDSRAVQPLIQALSDSYWEIRKGAASALGEIEDGAAVDALSACLKDSHIEVRKTAADALAEIDDPRAVKPMMELLSDPDWEIRKKAAHALGEIDDPASVPALCNAVKDENIEVRKTVIRALGEIQDRGAVNALLGVIDDPDWEIREKVVRALGEIGDPKTLESLSAKLKDDNEAVRRAAARALGEIRWRNE